MKLGLSLVEQMVVRKEKMMVAMLVELLAVKKDSSSETWSVAMLVV